ncbi:MAG: hypothetical protein ACFE8B_13845 [Candidatus Hermodarchaeota archaeon]
MTFKANSIEKQVEDFLENSFCSEDFVFNDEIQRKRLSLLSKLVANLFNCKNSTICFHNISNLIIVVLNIYNEKFPIDIYSNGKRNLTQKPNSKIKHILKEDLL